MSRKSSAGTSNPSRNPIILIPLQQAMSSYLKSCKGGKRQKLLEFFSRVSCNGVNWMDDNFDFDGKQKAASQRAPLELWDRLSILVLMITVCIGLYFLFIFVNPNASINLFPPAPHGPVTSTLTASPLQPSATWTADPIVEVTPTKTPGSASAPAVPFTAP